MDDYYGQGPSYSAYPSLQNLFYKAKYFYLE